MSKTHNHHRHTAALLRPPLRVRAWWVMRQQVTFALQDLMLTIADGTERQAIASLRRYVRTLERHGILRGLPARGQRSWRLVRDLGPGAPTDPRSAAEPLIDTNTGRPVPPLAGGRP